MINCRSPFFFPKKSRCREREFKMDSSTPHTSGAKKFFELLSTLDSQDAMTFFEATIILRGNEFSDEDAQLLIRDAYKLKIIIKSLIVAEIDSLRLPEHEHRLLSRLILDLEKVSSIRGLAMVVDQATIDQMESEFSIEPEGGMPE